MAVDPCIAKQARNLCKSLPRRGQRSLHRAYCPLLISTVRYSFCIGLQAAGHPEQSYGRDKCQTTSFLCSITGRNRHRRLASWLRRNRAKHPHCIRTPSTWNVGHSQLHHSADIPAVLGMSSLVWTLYVWRSGGAECTAEGRPQEAPLQCSRHLQ